MIYRYPEYYHDFSCIGGQCPETCCTGWKISIDERTCRKYAKASESMYYMPEFREKLKQGIDFKQRVFKTETGRCPFLGNDHLCDIYRQMGPRALCGACKRYPRHMEDYGQLKEVMLSLSCPEAARLILSQKSRNRFRVRVTAKKPSFHMPEDVLAQYDRYRHFFFEIVRDQRQPMEKRAVRLLKAAKAVSHEDFTVPPKVSKDILENGRQRIEYMEMTGGLEQIIGSWKSMLAPMLQTLRQTLEDGQYAQKRAAFKAAEEELALPYEHLMTYYLYSMLYWALYDGELSAKVRLASYYFIVVREMLFARWLMEERCSLEDLVMWASRLARMCEHSDDNVNALEAMVGSSPAFNLRRMTGALLY